MKGGTGLQRDIALNSVSGADTDTVVKVSVDQLPAAGSHWISVGARQQNLGGYRLRIKVAPDGSVIQSLLCQAVTGGTCVKPTVNAGGTVAGLTVAAGQQLNMRLQAQGSGTTTLRGKVWLAGTAEPAAWQITGTDTTAALQGPGGVYLYAYSSSTTNAIVTSWDDLAVNLL